MGGLDILGVLAAQVLALSLATERIVTILKTIRPGLFAEPVDASLGPMDSHDDRWRKFSIQVIAFVVAWGAASFLHDGTFAPFGKVPIGNSGAALPTWLFGLLATGGSAFWSSVLTITRTVKDLRVQDRSLSAVAVRRGTTHAHREEREAAIFARATQPQF